MSNKKAIVKAPINRIKEGSRLMRTHESMVDLINGRHNPSTILDVFASGLFGLDFLRSFEGNLEDDLIYSDDEDDDSYCPHHINTKPLVPHPSIRQLSEEEADRHARELIEEEERLKGKTERNKKKKLRKKEKKRMEKKTAVEDNLQEEQEDLDESGSSENQDENPIIESNAEANETPAAVETQNAPESASVGSDESSAEIKEEKMEVTVEIKKEEEEEEQKYPKQELKFNNSCAVTAKSEPEETAIQKSKKVRKKEKMKGVEFLLSSEKKPKVRKIDVPKTEVKPTPDEQTISDPAVQEYEKRSRELAGVGNRLAASGQYEMAVKYFTDAIKYNPKEYKLFGNRSLCYERMNQCENALRDADLALCMEPNWIKGLFRKGKALCGLKKYYEASLIYKEVLKLESTSAEATTELKRAQTLHLMEMGFTWPQSSEALKAHATLEEAVEALFGGNPGPTEASTSSDITEQVMMQLQEEEEDDGEWTVLQAANRPRPQQTKVLDYMDHAMPKSRSPTPPAKNVGYFSIWVGSLAPTVTYITLHEVFSRAGTVHGIKMLLEQQCAFVNYTRKEDCDRAIQCINGMVVEGMPLSVRYPNRAIQAGLLPKSTSTDPFSRPGPYKKECFFWRTTGCTRQDCTFRHVPENKNIDREKFTSRMGNFQM